MGITNPFLVGITGGMGAGKSLVCKILNNLGIPVYSSDDRAKDIMINNKILKKEIINHFGSKSYSGNKLNNNFLSQSVFNSSIKLLKMNNLVHPFVKEDFLSWVKKNDNKDYLVKESALLIDTGGYQELNFNVYVLADKTVRIKRIMERDPDRNKSDIIKIINNQIEDSKASKYCDKVINNDGELLLLPQVLKMHDQILKISKK